MRAPAELASGQTDFVVRMPSSSRSRYTGPTFSRVLRSVSSKIENANFLLLGKRFMLFLLGTHKRADERCVRAFMQLPVSTLVLLQLPALCESHVRYRACHGEAGWNGPGTSNLFRLTHALRGGVRASWFAAEMLFLDKSHCNFHWSTEYLPHLWPLLSGPGPRHRGGPLVL